MISEANVLYFLRRCGDYSVPIGDLSKKFRQDDEKLSATLKKLILKGLVDFRWSRDEFGKKTAPKRYFACIAPDYDPWSVYDRND